MNGDTLLIFGCIYGNYQALAALVAAQLDEDVAPSSIICTGDLAAYCADGDRVCSYFRQHLSAALVIRGNCERAIADDDDDCGCGFASGSLCERLSFSWHTYAKKSIQQDNKTWMKTLPPSAIIEFAGKRLAVIHADAQTDNNFIYASTETSHKRRIIEQLNVDGVIAGHSGIPFTDFIDDKIWHNSGALGMPANDGTSRVWYSKWRREKNQIRIEHRSLKYDIVAASQRMRQAKLPEDYQITLQTGIWPSDSVLPETERQQQGVAINLPSLFWETLEFTPH